MFDIGWTEMALIAVVAVIVIGPKELPKVMRELGVWVARARNMSRMFMDQLEEMSRQSGIDEVRKEAEALRQINPARQIEKVVDPDGVIARQSEELAKIGSAPDSPLQTPADPMAPLGEPPAIEPSVIEPPAPDQSDSTPAQPPADAAHPSRDPGSRDPAP
jgi:sec-independent protein translocase protein TatB